MANLSESYEALATRTTEALTRYKLAQESLAAAQAQAKASEAAAQLAREGQGVLRRLGEDARGLVNQVIDPVAQQGLQEIFGSQARYQTVFKKLPKAGFAARIVTGQGDQLGNPVATDGGSVAEIVSDAVLRPLVICLHRSGLNRFIGMDEPFAGVDGVNIGAVGSLLQELGRNFGVQFLIITHEIAETLDEYADKVVRWEVRTDGEQAD